ncbi:MAG TPA: hypothetical protein DEP46_17040 [Blastocatellia bacterium]|nr:hypothetical protein [Blastocatellia bacterium]
MQAIKTIAHFVIVFGFILGPALGVDGQKEVDLNEKRFDVSAKDMTFREILVQLAQKHDVPIGFYVSQSDEPASCRESVSLVLARARIAEVMTSLTAICPVYTWKIVANAVNVVPVARQDSLLDLIVHRVEVKDLTGQEILDMLFELDEVKQGLAKSGLTRDTTIPFWFREPSDRQRYTFSLENQKISDVLNYIIVNTDERSWIFYSLKSDPTLFSLRFF